MNFDFSLGEDFPHKVKTINAQKYIFCALRKQWYVLTKEEWVRQYWLGLLISNDIDTINMAVEVPISLYKQKKRLDLVLYKQAIPWLVIECKAPTVALGINQLNQLVRYQQTAASKYIMLTNGKYSMVFDCVQFPYQRIALESMFKQWDS